MQQVDKLKQRIQELVLLAKLNSGNPFAKPKEVKPEEPESE
jgi:hypothetical protein